MKSKERGFNGPFKRKDHSRIRRQCHREDYLGKIHKKDHVEDRRSSL